LNYFAVRRKTLFFVFFTLNLFASIFLCSCSLFTSHYDAIRHQNFTKLYAFHTKFIEDHTDGSDHVYLEDEIKSTCDTGDLKFREALIYAKSLDKDDKTGEKAVQFIHDEFMANCKKLIKKKKLYKPFYSQEALSLIKKNYEFAIKGELKRIGANAP